MTVIQTGTCQCGCGGKTAIVKETDKKRGAFKGQPRRFLLGHCRVQHGHSRRVTGASAEYRSWRAMVMRCTNERHPSYADYGGRGITIDPQWRSSFAEFLADMGPRPPGTMLERLDNNLGYCKENCAWKDSLEQARNRRSTKLNYEAVKVIKAQVSRGVSADLLARLRGVKQSTIASVVKGRIWSPVAKPRKRKEARDAQNV